MALLFLENLNDTLILLILYLDLVFFVSWTLLGAIIWLNRKFIYQLCTSNAAIISFIIDISKVLSILADPDFKDNYIGNVWRVIFYLTSLPIIFLMLLFILLGLAIYSQYTIKYEESKRMYYSFSTFWIITYIVVGIILAIGIVDSIQPFIENIMPGMFVNGFFVLGLTLIMLLFFFTLEFFRPLLFWTLGVSREEFFKIMGYNNIENLES
ncbi:MAG: hypothetical protein ACTSW1_08555 [Candidatus Hodarchaeales archaeon]